MKKMKRMLKGIISLAIVLSICVLPVNAAPYTIENQDWGSVSGMVLNCYTSGVVQSGTNVSTWTRTGNDSQKWYRWNDSRGARSLRPAANTSVALNANRSKIGTTANVITAESNVVEDYNIITFDDIKIGQTFRIALVGRLAHTKTVYLTAHGPNAFCTWEYYNSNCRWRIS